MSIPKDSSSQVTEAGNIVYGVSVSLETTNDSISDFQGITEVASTIFKKMGAVKSKFLNGIENTIKITHLPISFVSASVGILLYPIQLLQNTYIHNKLSAYSKTFDEPAVQTEDQKRSLTNLYLERVVKKINRFNEIINSEEHKKTFDDIQKLIKDERPNFVEINDFLNKLGIDLKQLTLEDSDLNELIESNNKIKELQEKLEDKGVKKNNLIEQHNKLNNSIKNKFSEKTNTLNELKAQSKQIEREIEEKSADDKTKNIELENLKKKLNEINSKIPKFYNIKYLEEELIKANEKKRGEFPGGEIAPKINDKIKNIEQEIENKKKEVIIFLKNEENLQLLKEIGARNLAENEQTLSAVSRNALLATGKLKVTTELKDFMYKLVKTLITAPIGFIVSSAALTTYVIIALGFAVTLPLWVSPLGWALAALGVLVIILDFVHEMRTKPNTYFENTLKLRRARIFANNVSFEFQKYKLEKQIQELDKYNDLKTIKDSYTRNAIKSSDLSNNGLPQHIKEILSKEPISKEPINSNTKGARTPKEAADLQTYIETRKTNIDQKIEKLKGEKAKTLQKAKELKGTIKRHEEKLIAATKKDFVKGGLSINYFLDEVKSPLWQKVFENLEPTSDADGITLSQALSNLLKDPTNEDLSLKAILKDKMDIDIEKIRNMEKNKIIENFEDELCHQVNVFLALNTIKLTEIARKKTMTK